MNSLSNFNTEPFIDALKAFFEELNVPVDYLADEPASAAEVLGERYKTTNEAHKLIEDVYALGVVNDAIFEEKATFKNLNDVKKKVTTDYDGLLIFGVTLKNRKDGLLITRSHLAEIARAFNRTFPYTPVTIIFKYGNLISIANSERFKYKQEWREGEKVGRVSLLMNVDCSTDSSGKLKTHQGHKRILNAISVDAIKEYDRRNKVESFSDLYKGWQQVFNTSILNEQFYKDYQQLSVKLIRAIYPSKIKDKIKAHQGALNLLNRMMFVYFIQKKKWLMNDSEFMFHFWQDYNEKRKKENTFHEKWLNKIFFKAFNGKAFNDPEIFKILPENYHSAILEFPYLNGGLFTPTDDDEFVLEDRYFESIFDFLQSYIFTISEDTSDEVNLEINPELLGKMYEGMINATDLNDVDAENGIVYTERPEINFMTRRSFVEVLNKKFPNSLSRDFLYHFCFDNHREKLELLKRYKVDVSVLRAAILSITALDPSCGSGSMLLGVIQLQVELIRCLDEFLGKPHSPKDDFLLKKQIISDSIYGVDIKEWAVRIAELRFWLYMIADAEFTTKELTDKPLLPNLDFKLRQGNSLLQEVGSMEFSVKGLFKGRKRNAGASRKLNEFIKKKKDFITNQNASNSNYNKLKDEELFVFREFIKEIISENNSDIRNLSKGGGQQDIFGAEKKGHLFEVQIETLEKENSQLEYILKSIKVSGRLPFSYDIDFMEIFLTKEDAGFDLIIGNPPYVRQEDILPAENAIELERLLLPKNKVEKATINKEYKEKLSTKVYQTYPFLNTKVKTNIEGKMKTIDIYGQKVPGRSDLYVYFQLLMPSLLNSKGTFCFIISNSWLDVEYGGYVQQFLLKHTQLHAIYDCNVRSFSAKVNTIIYLHSAIKNNNLTETKYKTLKPDGDAVKFIMNNSDYNDTSYAPLLIEQEHCQINTFKEHYRIISKRPKDLWIEGFDEESSTFTGDKWGGKYLRAPEIYYILLKKGRNILVPIKTVAEIKFGIKTGANDFFYVDENKINEYNIEEKYLIPIIKSPRECTEYLTSKTKAKWFLFSCNELKKDIKNTNALKYIEKGERDKIHLKASCKARNIWYSVPSQETPDFVFPLINNDSPKTILNDAKMFFDANLNCGYLKSKINKNAFQSTLTLLSWELLGMKNLGEGAIKLNPTYTKESLIFATEKKLPFLNRKIYSIFKELGFDKEIPIRDQEPNPLSDRKKLDDIIFEELGLTKDERKEVYWATAELVMQRLNKAASR